MCCLTRVVPVCSMDESVIRCASLMPRALDRAWIDHIPVTPPNLLELSSRGNKMPLVSSN